MVTIMGKIMGIIKVTGTTEKFCFMVTIIASISIKNRGQGGGSLEPSLPLC
jgi:hypothetical protein